MKTTALRTSSGIIDSHLPEIQALLRAGDIDKAVVLYKEVGGFMASEDIAKEVEFIHRVDAARKKEAGTEHNAWEWLVLVALGLDWEEDEEKFNGPYEWLYPMLKEDIVGMAAPFCRSIPIKDLEFAFDVLVEQGLFFTVHPGVFAEACYYCSYDPDFPLEIPEYSRYAPKWRALQKKFDRKYDSGTWRSTGVCWGQGSLASETPLKLCVGSCCCRFLSGEPACQHNLPFNPLILPARVD